MFARPPDPTPNVSPTDGAGPGPQCARRLGGRYTGDFVVLELVWIGADEDCQQRSRRNDLTGVNRNDHQAIRSWCRRQTRSNSTTASSRNRAAISTRPTPRASWEHKIDLSATQVARFGMGGRALKDLLAYDVSLRAITANEPIVAVGPGHARASHARRVPPNYLRIVTDVGPVASRTHARKRAVLKILLFLAPRVDHLRERKAARRAHPDVFALTLGIGIVRKLQV